MTLQFIQDNKGNTTGVFIPIEDWQSLKNKYVELQKEEVKYPSDLNSWQKQIVEERLNDYYKNPTKVSDFDKTIDDVEKSL